MAHFNSIKNCILIFFLLQIISGCEEIPTLPAIACFDDLPNSCTLGVDCADIRFDASCSSPSADILTYEWDIEDQTISEKKVIRSLTKVGIQVIRLTVRTITGETVEKRDTIQVLYPTITDDNGTKYNYFRLADGKCWLLDNLNYEKPDRSWCYEDPKNCEAYGKMYEWQEAMCACADLGDNWELPSKQDWEDLIEVYGGGDAGKALMELIVGGSSGFDALLGGYSSSSLGDNNVHDEFSGLGDLGRYWSSTSDAETSKKSSVHLNQQTIGLLPRDPSWGYSVRCIKKQ